MSSSAKHVVASFCRAFNAFKAESHLCLMHSGQMDVQPANSECFNVSDSDSASQRWDLLMEDLSLKLGKQAAAFNEGNVTRLNAEKFCKKWVFDSFGKINDEHALRNFMNTSKDYFESA